MKHAVAAQSTAAQSCYMILVLFTLSGPITLHKARVSSRFRRMKVGMTELAWSPTQDEWLVNAGLPTMMLNYCFSGPGPATRRVLTIHFRDETGCGPHRTKLCGNACQFQRPRHAIRMHGGLTWEGSTESTAVTRRKGAYYGWCCGPRTLLREGRLRADVVMYLDRHGPSKDLVRHCYGYSYEASRRLP